MECGAATIECRAGIARSDPAHPILHLQQQPQPQQQQQQQQKEWEVQVGFALSAGSLRRRVFGSASQREATVPHMHPSGAAQAGPAQSQQAATQHRCLNSRRSEAYLSQQGPPLPGVQQPHTRTDIGLSVAPPSYVQQEGVVQEQQQGQQLQDQGQGKQQRQQQDSMGDRQQQQQQIVDHAQQQQEQQQERMGDRQQQQQIVDHAQQQQEQQKQQQQQQQIMDMDHAQQQQQQQQQQQSVEHGLRQTSAVEKKQPQGVEHGLRLQPPSELGLKRQPQTSDLHHTIAAAKKLRTNNPCAHKQQEQRLLQDALAALSSVHTLAGMLSFVY